MDRTVMDVICPACDKIIEGTRTYINNTAEGPWHPDCVPQLIPTAQRRKGEGREHKERLVCENGVDVFYAPGSNYPNPYNRRGNDRRQA